jgi:DNA uptake protein ComE-like DNA-binding protein
MKQWLASYFTFTRVERLGIAALTLLLIVLVIMRFTINLWAHPSEANVEASARLNKAWQEYQLKEDSLRLAYNGPSNQTTGEASLFSFDPNTLDSDGFIRLGMPAKAVKGLLNWRRHGKHFYKPEDLKPLYNLPAETYAALEPYIHISGGERAYSDHAAYSPFPAVPDVIDLNTADSGLLDRGIRGIGATLARKIVQRRTALGGYYRHEQLLEVYRFPDSTYQVLRTKLRIDPSQVKRMNLNTADLAQMSNHPYIGERTAKNILMYRDGIRHYERIEQLREVPLMNEEIYRKIAPYFTVE